MAVLKGREISLDGLLGFAKLQELLALIIAQLNEQDAALARVASSVAANAAGLAEQKARSEKCTSELQRLNEQLQQLDRVKEDVANDGKRLERLVSGIDGRVGALEPQLADLTAKELATGEQLRRLDAGVAELRERQGSAEATTRSLVQGLAAAERAIGGLPNKWSEDIRNTVGGLRGAAAEHGLVETLERLDGEVASAAQSLSSVCGQCAELTEASGTLTGRVAQLEAAGEASARAENTSRRLLEQLEAQAAAAQGGLDAKEGLRQLQESLHRLQDRLDALAEKAGLDVQRLSCGVAELQRSLRRLLERGSSATSKCLSCMDPRYQLEDQIIVGTDGRPYRQRPSRKGCSDATTLGRRPQSAQYNDSSGKFGSGLPPPKSASDSHLRDASGVGGGPLNRCA